MRIHVSNMGAFFGGQWQEQWKGDLKNRYGELIIETTYAVEGGEPQKTGVYNDR